MLALFFFETKFEKNRQFKMPFPYTVTDRTGLSLFALSKTFSGLAPVRNRLIAAFNFLLPLHPPYTATVESAAKRCLQFPAMHDVPQIPDEEKTIP